jgi:hypothetical protein
MWEIDIKNDPTEIGGEDVDWIQLDQDSFHWRAFLNTTMTF